MAVWAVQLRRGLHFAVAGSPCIELRYYLALVVPTVGPAHTYAIVVQEKPASSPHLQVGYLRRLRLTCPRGSGPSGVRSDAWVGLGWASVIHCRLCFVALHLVSGAPPSTSRAPPPLAKVRHCLFHLEPGGSHMPNQPVFATVEGGGVPCVSRSHLSGNFSFHFSGLIP